MRVFSAVVDTGSFAGASDRLNIWHGDTLHGPAGNPPGGPSAATHNTQLLVNAAMEGMGILYEPDILVYEAIRQKRLVQVLDDWQTDEFTLFAVYANRQFLPPNVRSFIEFLVDYFGPQPYWSL